jgi:sugar transferase EpsL
MASHYRSDNSSKKIKRGLDVALASVGMMALAPIMAIIALAIRVRMGKPVIFRQARAGFHGRPFTLLKFRTMIHKTDSTGCLLPDAERLTRFGRFLRKTSLDEIPQLWNVLRGDMSLVGPRPLPVEYLQLYTPEQNRRHDVPQGIVGWAGGQGRNLNSWEKKFQLDLWYVDNWSLRLDLRILCMTVVTVLRSSGVSAEDHATCLPFTGSK